MTSSKQPDARSIVVNAFPRSLEPGAHDRVRSVTLTLARGTSLGGGNYEAEATGLPLMCGCEPWVLRRIGRKRHAGRLYVGREGVWGEPYDDAGSPYERRSRQQTRRQKEMLVVAYAVALACEIVQPEEPTPRPDLAAVKS